MECLGYRGKTVVVLGCFSGMGEATARWLLDLGAEVHGFDFKEPALGLASFTLLDLRDPLSIDAAAKELPGEIQALFNCAGLPHTSPSIDVMKVNYAGIRRFTEQVLPNIVEGGCIATISSRAGRSWSQRAAVLADLLSKDSFEEAVRWCELHPEAVREGYVLSKEMVIYWTMSLSSALIKRGIRINCTLPGSTQTPMTSQFSITSSENILKLALQPINRYSTPAEQAGPLLFLNSTLASYVNGVALPVEGGFLAAVVTDTLGDADPMVTLHQQE